MKKGKNRPYKARRLPAALEPWPGAFRRLRADSDGKSALPSKGQEEGSNETRKSTSASTSTDREVGGTAGEGGGA